MTVILKWIGKSESNQMFEYSWNNIFFKQNKTQFHIQDV